MKRALAITNAAIKRYWKLYDEPRAEFREADKRRALEALGVLNVLRLDFEAAQRERKNARSKHRSRSAPSVKHQQYAPSVLGRSNICHGTTDGAHRWDFAIGKCTVCGTQYS